ncbi:MAG TPA: hypothetical protein VFA28_06835 [Bryobacteraceae bacterium]|nr:hypothetical protein [Bryobacteraceae bacterium]
MNRFVAITTEHRIEKCGDVLAPPVLISTRRILICGAAVFGWTRTRPAPGFLATSVGYAQARSVENAEARERALAWSVNPKAAR